MNIVEMRTLSKGGHNNRQGDNLTIPHGWAVVPQDLETPNFPFGEVTAKEIDGVMTVTKWVATDIPETEEITVTPSEVEQLRADIDYIAVMTGVTL